ncbi:cholinesterase 1-like isoform X2 [Mya arenaria]|uniref:cholinesterase 1-like isoform X2 n=1 Tax=Mya arenaria TaxID=6604 RepID=UPI0022E33201|nr:cholinesterase 1-like isoform X2 [Mya arenaria]
MKSFFGVVLIVFFTRSEITGVVVHTSVGDIVGVQEVVDYVDGPPKTVSKFLGIPFAENTGGQNRFKKPIPTAPFTRAFNATALPVGCRQGMSIIEDSYRQYGLDFSEDCLVLSVFVPHSFNETMSLPVMVWVYGGGYLSGSITPYPGDVLATFGDVVVVTVNYRLGPFGFLRSSDGQLVGNQGLWDQHLAFRWVHDNIAAFTGNPDAVTIFGESAGAASVSLQALYPGNKGLFQRVIAESGSALAPWAVTPSTDISGYLDSTGCGLDIFCLASLPVQQIQLNTSDQNVTGQFKPTIDGDFLVATPHEIIHGNSQETEAARRFFASLDIITGVNTYEGASFIPTVWPQILGFKHYDNFTMTRKLFTDVAIPSLLFITHPENVRILKPLIEFEYTNWTKPDDDMSLKLALVAMVTDSLFFYPALATAVGHVTLADSGRFTYMYEFSAEPTTHGFMSSSWITGNASDAFQSPTPNWVHGPNHGDEMKYVFGYPTANKYRVPGDGSTDRDRAKTVMTLWSNFAKHGNPNMPMDIHGLSSTPTPWEQFNASTHTYYEISNDQCSTNNHFHSRKMAFWGDLVKFILGHDRECHFKNVTDIPYFPKIIIG